MMAVFTTLIDFYCDGAEVSAPKPTEREEVTVKGEVIKEVRGTHGMYIVSDLGVYLIKNNFGEVLHICKTPCIITEKSSMDGKLMYRLCYYVRGEVRQTWKHIQFFLHIEDIESLRDVEMLNFSFNHKKQLQDYLISSLVKV